MTRRPLRRPTHGIGTGAIGNQSPMIGINGFTSTANYTGATSETGDAAGFGFAILISIDSQAVASQTRAIFSIRSGSTGAYIGTAGTNTTTRFAAFDGGGVIRVSPQGSIAGGEVAKNRVLFGQHQGAGNAVRLFDCISQISTETACTGYTAGSGTKVGYDAGSGVASDGVTLFGAMTWRGVATLAQIQAYYQACKLGRDIQTTMSGVTVTNAWSVRQAYSGSLPASIPNLIGGGIALSVVGTPTVATNSAPIWVA